MQTKSCWSCILISSSKGQLFLIPKQNKISDRFLVDNGQVCRSPNDFYGYSTCSNSSEPSSFVKWAYPNFNLHVHSYNLASFQRRECLEEAESLHLINVGGLISYNPSLDVLGMWPATLQDVISNIKNIPRISPPFNQPGERSNIWAVCSQ